MCSACARVMSLAMHVQNTANLHTKKDKALTHSHQLQSMRVQPCALEMRISGDSTPVQASNHWLDEIRAKSLLVQ